VGEDTGEGGGEVGAFGAECGECAPGCQCVRGVKGVWSCGSKCPKLSG
jgi:hypothetical protein